MDARRGAEEDTQSTGNRSGIVVRELKGDEAAGYETMMLEEMGLDSVMDVVTKEQLVRTISRNTTRLSNKLSSVLL